MLTSYTEVLLKGMGHMQIILTERCKTFQAHLSGGVWREVATSEATLEGLLAYFKRVKEKDGKQRLLRVDGEKVVIDFITGAGVSVRQIIIDHNACDREVIMGELQENL